MNKINTMSRKQNQDRTKIRIIKNDMKEGIKYES